MDTLYTLSGSVVSGEHMGTKLGFPTANLDSTQLQKELEHIPCGVYAGIVTRVKDNTVYKAGIVVGAQDSHTPPKIEAHLIDFTGNLYSETLTFDIKKHIREIRSYNSNSRLIYDIEKDIAYIKNLNL